MDNCKTEGGAGMAEIVDLNKIGLPDCKSCTDPTKQILARTMDVEGAGIPGVLYTCTNRRCRARRNEIAKYITRVGV